MYFQPCLPNKLYYNAKLFAEIRISKYCKNDILKFCSMIFYKQVSDPRKCTTYCGRILVVY